MAPLNRAALLAAALLLPLPAQAIVKGTVERDPNGLRRHVVRLETGGGRLCSGVIVAPDLVLTAAHCLARGVGVEVVGVDRRFRPVTRGVLAVARHPSFVPGTTPADQPGVDLALVRLAQPFGADFAPLEPSGAGEPARGEPLEVAGFGATAEARQRTARTLRRTELVALGRLTLQNTVLVAADGATLAQRLGAGACLGDSGGPVLRAGRLAGLVSWAGQASQGRETTACGGLTAVTPLQDHAGWIAATAQGLSRVGNAWTVGR